jgi:hypothetical protein
VSAAAAFDRWVSLFCSVLTRSDCVRWQNLTVSFGATTPAAEAAGAIPVAHFHSFSLIFTHFHSFDPRLILMFHIVSSFYPHLILIFHIWSSVST